MINGVEHIFISEHRAEHEAEHRTRKTARNKYAREGHLLYLPAEDTKQEEHKSLTEIAEHDAEQQCISYRNEARDIDIRI